jgi:hypothetical protein
MRKTFCMSWREVLWGESWVNLIMQMRDMPYYHHFSSREQKGKAREPWDRDGEPHITFNGDEEIIKRKFSKFLKKKDGGT